jgi:coenzyme F420-reducing hydrogenase gamma subunit
MYVPGCPPRPEMLLNAVVKLQDKIRKEQFVERPRPGESMDDFCRRTGWSSGQTIACMPTLAITEPQRKEPLVQALGSVEAK